jgi:hypothetical protein
MWFRPDLGVAADCSHQSARVPGAQRSGKSARMCMARTSAPCPSERLGLARPRRVCIRQTDVQVVIVGRALIVSVRFASGRFGLPLVSFHLEILDCPDGLSASPLISPLPLPVVTERETSLEGFLRRTQSTHFVPEPPPLAVCGAESTPILTTPGGSELVSVIHDRLWRPAPC